MLDNEFSDFCKTLGITTEFTSSETSMNSLHEISYVACSDGKWKIAEKIASRMIELYPNDWRGYFLIGQAIYCSGMISTNHNPKKQSAQYLIKYKTRTK